MFNDKAVVVTGDPRSGTSLMMQTLKLLGVEVAGLKWPVLDPSQEDVENDNFAGLPEDRVELLKKIKRMNPKGFYEIPSIVARGFVSFDVRYGKYEFNLRNKAVKIINTGIVPNIKAGFRGTDPNLVYKYILCIRDPKSVSKSQTDLELPLKIRVSTDDDAWGDVERPSDPTRFAIGNGNLCTQLLAGFDSWDKFVVVDYDELLNDRGSVIGRICHKLQINPTDEQLQAAIDNINPTLSRSALGFKGWPSWCAQAGDVAEDVYHGLRSFDYEDMAAAAVKYDDWMARQELERVRWYDRATGLMINAELYRTLKENTTLKNKLIDSFLKGVKLGRHFITNPDFIPAKSQYKVIRPLDIGPLTRPRYVYYGAEVTWEEAHSIHMNLLDSGKAKCDRSLVAQVVMQRYEEID